MRLSKLVQILSEHLERHGDMETEAAWEGITEPITGMACVTGTTPDGIPYDAILLEADRNGIRHALEKWGSRLKLKTGTVIICEPEETDSDDEP